MKTLNIKNEEFEREKYGREEEQNNSDNEKSLSLFNLSNDYIYEEKKDIIEKRKEVRNYNKF